jgi:hypothetical protein
MDKRRRALPVDTLNCCVAQRLGAAPTRSRGHRPSWPPAPQRARRWRPSGDTGSRWRRDRVGAGRRRCHGRAWCHVRPTRWQVHKRIRIGFSSNAAPASARLGRPGWQVQMPCKGPQSGSCRWMENCCSCCTETSTFGPQHPPDRCLGIAPSRSIGRRLDACGQPSRLTQLELDAVRAQADDLRGEIVEYEHLRSGAVSAFEAVTLEDLPTLLIKARIARGWSQRRLGEALGIAEQQVQRYESTGVSGSEPGEDLRCRRRAGGSDDRTR